MEAEAVTSIARALLNYWDKSPKHWRVDVVAAAVRQASDMVLKGPRPDGTHLVVERQAVRTLLDEVESAWHGHKAMASTD